jgi:hypothetical protein
VSICRYFRGGVKIADRHAMQAWIAEFNDRPFEERDAILGVSLPDE